MLRKTLLGALAVVAMTLAIPSMAQATLGTPVPTLPSGVDPAHIADLDGNPVSAHATLSGSLTISSAVLVVCDYHVVIDFNSDGTSAVTSFTASNCVVQGAAGAICSVMYTATDLAWGDRLGFDTYVGTFRDYISVSQDMTISGPNCPISGIWTETASLFPEISVSGSSITAHFWDNSGPEISTGTIVGPLGTRTIEGTLSGTLTSDEADAFQLVNTGA